MRLLIIISAVKNNDNVCVLAVHPKSKHLRQDLHAADSPRLTRQPVFEQIIPPWSRARRSHVQLSHGNNGAFPAERAGAQRAERMARRPLLT